MRGSPTTGISATAPPTAHRSTLGTCTPLPGVFTARLTVSDGQGNTDSATVTIRPGNDAPTANITSPADGSLYRGGDTITAFRHGHRRTGRQPRGLGPRLAGAAAPRQPHTPAPPGVGHGANELHRRDRPRCRLVLRGHAHRPGLDRSDRNAQHHPATGDRHGANHEHPHRSARDLRRPRLHDPRQPTHRRRLPDEPDSGSELRPRRADVLLPPLVGRRAASPNRVHGAPVRFRSARLLPGGQGVRALGHRLQHPVPRGRGRPGHRRGPGHPLGLGVRGQRVVAGGPRQQPEGGQRPDRLDRGLPAELPDPDIRRTATPGPRRPPRTSTLVPYGDTLGVVETDFPTRTARYVRVQTLAARNDLGRLLLRMSASSAPADDETPPDTTITSGPSGTIGVRDASFAFTSEPSATFECRLGTSGAWESCTSPRSFTGLADGTYEFQVRAVTGAGTDPTPATRTFTVDTTAPDTTITSGPSGVIGVRDASFAFTSEPSATFECRLGTTARGRAARRRGPSRGSPTARTSSRSGRSPARAPTQHPPPAPSPSTPPHPRPRSTRARPARSRPATAAFRFSSEPSATFQCKLDQGNWAACTSEHTLTNLAEGAHTFNVRATDTAGNTDQTPATRTFTVDCARGGQGVRAPGHRFQRPVRHARARQGRRREPGHPLGLGSSRTTSGGRSTSAATGSWTSSGSTGPRPTRGAT